MRHLLATALLLVSVLPLRAQGDAIFRRTVYNAELSLYLVLNLYDKDVTIAGQEFMGQMAGYLGDEKDFRKWLVTGAELTSPTSARLEISNDEGSEDLRATLTYNRDGTYTLRQGNGSTMKIARDRKWLKLPKELKFTEAK